MNSTALPVIDLGALSADAQWRAVVMREVEHALTARGFMYLKGHGIDSRVLERAFAAAALFFGQPQAAKQRYAYAGVDANFGFQGMQSERLDPNSRADLKETFTMRDALRHADEDALWPAGDFRDAALALYTVGLRAAYRLMEILAGILGLSADFFSLRHRGENVTLRFLHYPAALPAQSSQLGAGAHTDYGSITLLFQDSVGGLELLGADGGWHLAPPMEGAAVINTGDLMERWTNGRFRSTVHRVQPIMGSRDRYSIALFVDPDPAIEVDCFASCVTADRPARYARTTAGEHIREKIAATHASPTS